MITLRPNHIAAAILLTSLATSAYFFAQGTTSLVASKLFGMDGPEANARGRAGGRNNALVAAVAPRTVSARNIIERDIFEPPSLLPDAAVPGEPGEVITAEPMVLDERNQPQCPAELKLTGAMVNPALPSWSYASLAQGTTGPLLFRVEQTFASRTVARIESGFDPDEPLLPGGQRRPRIRVVLRDAGGQYCQITMFHTPTGEAPAATTTTTTPTVVAPAAPTATTGTGDPTAAELEAGITRVSDLQFNVNRQLMERALAQPESLFRTARLIPEEANGSVNGLKIYGVRRTSMLGRLGILNGDVLGAVNGTNVGSADDLIQATQAFARGGQMSINVVRRGQPVTLTYQVQ